MYIRGDSTVYEWIYCLLNGYFKQACCAMIHLWILTCSLATLKPPGSQPEQKDNKDCSTMCATLYQIFTYRMYVLTSKQTIQSLHLINMRYKYAAADTGEYVMSEILLYLYIKYIHIL